MKVKRSNENDETQWIGLSDMMLSLMLIFFMISIIYMAKLQIATKRLEKIQGVEQALQATRQGIHAELKQVFDKNAKDWGAELSPDLTLRFINPDTLFDAGSASLNKSYKNTLSGFFPQYINIMMQPAYQNQNKEIRIEGHTSSYWSANTSADQAYFLNMELSQRRTRETLNYLMNNTNLNDQQKLWLKKHFRAIGFSSADTRDAAGKPNTDISTEDVKMSQRVEFRVVTNSDDILYRELDKDTGSF